MDVAKRRQAIQEEFVVVDFSLFLFNYVCKAQIWAHTSLAFLFTRKSNDGSIPTTAVIVQEFLALTVNVSMMCFVFMSTKFAIVNSEYSGVLLVRLNTFGTESRIPTVESQTCS